MSNVTAGKRSWKCPDCGSEVLLSVTQLDPIACEACLERMRGAPAGPSKASIGTSPGPLGVWNSLPETTKLLIVAAAFMTGLLVGLPVGYFSGKSSSGGQTREISVADERRGNANSSREIVVEKEEDRPDPPGPGYRWVRGRIRKDGTRGPSHWAKDPNYKSSDDSPPGK